MEAKIFISGRIIKGETLVDVIRQHKSFEDVTEITVEINSNGGNKNEGEAIFDYLKNIDSEVPVTTKTGKAYSIAAKIFAAGSKRIIEDTDKALMIHFASAKTEGTAEQLEEIAAELRKIEDEFVEFYSEHLNIDEDTVRNLLDNETFVSGTNAVELGFATEVEAMAEIVAELNIDKSNYKKMTTKKRSTGQKLLEAMAEFVGIDLKDKVEINAEMTLQDSNATDIVFADLESGDTPKVGDKATIDGKAIEDGSYVMPSLEESTLVFVDGAVSEILPKEEETEEDKEARLAAEAEAEKTEVKAEEVQQISVWSMNVLNTDFAVGDIVKREGWEEGTEESVGSGEFQLEDGRRVITDATGKIVVIKEAEAAKAVEVDVETEANFEELLEKVTNKVKVEIKAEFELKLSEKDKEIVALKKNQSSKEFKAEAKEVPETKTELTGAAKYIKAAKELK